MKTSMGELDVVLTPALQQHVGARDTLITDKVLRALDKIEYEFSQGCETWYSDEYGGQQRVGRIVPIFDLTRGVVTIDVRY